jgi:cell division protein FtsQ
MSTQAPARARPIDPRVRARRAAVQREQGRRRLRVLLAILVLLVALLAAWLAVQSSLLAVRTIDVQGATLTGDDEVRRAAQVGRSDPLVFVDLGAVARRVEQLPWVEEARVTRDFPSTLHIEVTERAAAGWYEDGDEVFLVDASGRVLETREVAPALPEIVGLEAGARPGGSVTPHEAASVAVALPPELVERVVKVRIETAAAAPTAILQLDEGPEIRLGTLDRLGEKGAAAFAVLGVLQEPVPRYIDVAVPEAPVTG